MKDEFFHAIFHEFFTKKKIIKATHSAVVRSDLDTKKSPNMTIFGQFLAIFEAQTDFNSNLYMGAISEVVKRDLS